QPTALILEDLQWTHESLEALKVILPLVHNLPLLIIGTYRNDETPDLPDKLPDMELMTLERLSKSHITALSAAMLGEAGSQSQVVDLLYRETEGNVFFIIEVVRALAESAGSLSNIGFVTLPEHITTGGVKEIIESRLKHVPEQLELFLKLAAIAGRRIDPVIMKALIAQNETARHTVATTLLNDPSATPQAILDYMFLVCSNAAVFSAQEDTWSFAHDKLREAVLGRIPPEEKPPLYRQVAETIEQVHSDDLEPWAVMLAQYWAEADDQRKEAHYTFIAAEKIAEIGVLSLARQLFQRLLQIRAYEFHENPTLQKGIIMHRLGSIFRRMGNFKQALQHEMEAIAIFEQLDDQHWLCSAYGEMGDIYLRYEQVEPAKEYFEKSLALARAIGDPKTLGFSVMNLGNLAQVIGDAEGSLPYRIESYNLLKEAGTPVEFSKAINNLAITYDMMGDYERAIALHEEALAIRRQYNDRQGLVYTLNNLGMIHLDMKHYEKAREYLQEALSLSRELNAYMAQAYCLGSMCDIEFHTHNYAACRDYAEQLLALALRHDIPYSILKAYLMLGDLAVQERNYIAAQDYYAQALEIADNVQNQPSIRLCLYKMAIVRLNLNDPITALTILACIEDGFNEQNRPSDWDMYWTLSHKQAKAGAEAAVQKGKALSLADTVAMVRGAI
ncbi:MAG: tetratricopeptide repeat protein, partial [Chloroflexi bacterium]